MLPKKPRLALTVGDPAGIGPEIVARSIADARVAASADLLVIGPRFLRESLMAQANGRAGVDWQDADDERPLEKVKFGVAQKEGGRAALAALALGHRLAHNREVDALVTAPVCKEAMHLAGEAVEGQTELLSRWAQADDCQMLAIAGEMRVLIATRHMALIDAIHSLTPELIEQRLVLLNYGLQNLGIKAPRLALAGLNPHASEHGLFGDEEANVLEPALAACREKGLDVSGPEPPDTVFVRAAAGGFDAVLALYHDQGFIPVKLAAPDSAITLLLGMPYLRVSPAHGTAFDIVGKGIARADGLVAALLAAADFAARGVAVQAG